ncbi:phospholipase D-like protein [Herbihabitans rhizosphaerae]|uniref:Phospholipase D-like protein n=1 Tax=Herbihabitans rhizosphaerae TaxID=1872711 RepID=A0A4Q7KL87_9PSEU|nr:PLD nuclease N-terminal domain-containing protein [Herbihabitans rhizosphaerae]RZS34696.1 phospholipase D-like protein [Herbihabitans rhizosphaerae]
MLTAAPALLVEGTDGSDAGVAVIVVIAVILGLIQLILWIAAAISILCHDRLTGGGKFLWFVVIIGFSFLGCLGWFFFGRSAQLVKTGAPSPTHA